MIHSLWLRSMVSGLAIGLLIFVGCADPNGKNDRGAGDQKQEAEAAVQTSDVPQEPAGTAAAEDVAAVKALLDGLGGNASYKMATDGRLTEITISDGSKLASENLALFGKLTDLESLQIANYRDLNDEMVAQLKPLTELQTLELSNSVIGDPSVETVISSFPKLTNLDLSYNPNITNSAMKVLANAAQLERLTLIQDRFNDIGTINIEKMKNLKVLDIRGNMEAGDLTMEIVGLLPKLAVLKHRSTTVSDYGIDCLAESKSLKSLLMQDFSITGSAGESLARCESLTELEIFRCQGMDSRGVVALKGMPLTRLKLRDLPAVDDMAMEVFEDLPSLQRLYLHEIESVSDEGLQSLGNLESLQILDIWSVPQMTDATIDVIATLPNIKELSIRATAVTDAAVDKLLTMPALQSLTFKENGSVTDAGLQKLAKKKWNKLDAGQ